MPFGSVFRTFQYVSITSVERQSYIPAFAGSDDVQTSFQNSFFTRLGFKFVGIPHIGLRLRAKKIMKNVPFQVTNMLDAGFGTGVYSFTLANKVRAIEAIDIDTAKIDYVRSINQFRNIHFQKMDLTNLTFEDSSFDLIICSEVLDYIEKYEAAFSELTRVLKPGGILLMTTPHNLGQKAIDNKDDYGYIHSGYTKNDIQDLCIRNGLVLQKAEGYSYYIAEKASRHNYAIADKKILLAILFYPLYALARLGDILLPIDNPHGMFFKIMK